MLRRAFVDRLKQAIKAREMGPASTIRLILAALKDRDIAAQARGSAQGFSDAEIPRMPPTRIRRRPEPLTLFEQGERNGLAQRESERIVVIGRFLRHRLDLTDVEAALIAVIKDIGAVGMKGTGRVMGSPRGGPRRSYRFCTSGGDCKAATGLTSALPLGCPDQ